MLAWLLATCPDPSIRNGAEAVDVARRLVRAEAVEVARGPMPPNGSREALLISSREALFMRTLAAAYAEAGRFSQAVAEAELAVAKAKSAGNRILALQCQAQLELYRAGRPCRDVPQAPRERGESGEGRGG
jgi:hypothetical protein